MADTCPTVKIVASDPDQGLFVVINESDVDLEQHELYVESPHPEPKARKTKGGDQ